MHVSARISFVSAPSPSRVLQKHQWGGWRHDSPPYSIFEAEIFRIVSASLVHVSAPTTFVSAPSPSRVLQKHQWGGGAGGMTAPPIQYLRLKFSGSLVLR